MKKLFSKEKKINIIWGTFILFIGAGIGMLIPHDKPSKRAEELPHTLGIKTATPDKMDPNKIEKLPLASFSLEDIIDEKETPPFACSFGKFKVEMVKSKYKNHKYFKVHGSGILLNSGSLHTNVGSHPQIIYAVPNDSAITNGATLSGYCIAMTNVPYEGKERENIDSSAALMKFYLLN